MIGSGSSCPWRPLAMKVQRRLKNMNIFEHAGGFAMPRVSKQILVCLLSLALLFATLPQNLSANQAAQPPAPAQATQVPSNAPAPPYAQQTPEQLQQLVAPIALYPDS